MTLENIETLQIFAEKDTQHSITGSIVNMLKRLYTPLKSNYLKPPEHKVHEKYKALGKNYYCSCGVMFVDFERNGN